MPAGLMQFAPLGLLAISGAKAGLWRTEAGQSGSLCLFGPDKGLARAQ